MAETLLMYFKFQLIIGYLHLVMLGADVFIQEMWKNKCQK